LLGIQRQWRDAQRCALGYVFTVGFQHGFLLSIKSKNGVYLLASVG
jgi:hypothetical protein